MKRFLLSFSIGFGIFFLIYLAMYGHPVNYKRVIFGAGIQAVLQGLLAVYMPALSRRFEKKKEDSIAKPGK